MGDPAFWICVFAGVVLGTVPLLLIETWNSSKQTLRNIIIQSENVPIHLTPK